MSNVQTSRHIGTDRIENGDQTVVVGCLGKQRCGSSEKMGVQGRQDHHHVNFLFVAFDLNYYNNLMMEKGGRS